MAVQAARYSSIAACCLFAFLAIGHQSTLSSTLLLFSHRSSCSLPERTLRKLLEKLIKTVSWKLADKMYTPGFQCNDLHALWVRCFVSRLLELEQASSQEHRDMEIGDADHRAVMYSIERQVFPEWRGNDADRITGDADSTF